MKRSPVYNNVLHFWHDSVKGPVSPFPSINYYAQLRSPDNSLLQHRWENCLLPLWLNFDYDLFVILEIFILIRFELRTTFQYIIYAK